MANPTLTEKEINSQLTDEANLRAILIEDLYAYGGSNESDISYVTKLLHGLILGMGIFFTHYT